MSEDIFILHTRHAVVPTALSSDMRNNSICYCIQIDKTKKADLSNKLAKGSLGTAVEIIRALGLSPLNSLTLQTSADGRI